ncbi:MAG TPA: hypothetical protein VMN81_10465 [Vicinamibacterales bacterium]|nr:hypothetical protein [Vicinamibacterales bacterium]
MTRTNIRLLAATALTLAISACGGGPTFPALQGVKLILPAQAEGRLVTCETCTPAAWGVLETSITLENNGTRDRRISTVESRVLNRTRNSVIATNTRPNKDFPLLDLLLPRGGRASLDVGVVYSPLPPPTDDIWFAVIVTFDDGATIGDQVRLLTRVS